MLPTLENVTNFTTALRALSFPASAIFSLPDLESTGWEERYVAPAPSRLVVGTEYSWTCTASPTLGSAEMIASGIHVYKV